MKLEGNKSIANKKYRLFTAVSKVVFLVADNFLNWEFNVYQSGKLLVYDKTYIKSELVIALIKSSIGFI
jgi:hypothetical protein